MHVHCVAAAILVGCALVDWRSPAARSGVSPPSVGVAWPVSWLGAWPEQSNSNPCQSNGENKPRAKSRHIRATPRQPSALEVSSAGAPRPRPQRQVAAAPLKRPAVDVATQDLRALFG
jgi:hypothetical protein